MPWRYRFWLPTPGVASEREPHCVLERGILYSDILRGVLEPRGWTELDWTSMSAPWLMRIRDGLHPDPMTQRMAAYLLLHHLCHAESPC
ncbi:unnamed protein product [Discosporangium mesarthrocarpum]